MPPALSSQKHAEPGLQTKILPDYDADGFDLTLIRWMLSLTTLERLQVLQQAVCSLERLRHAKSVY